MLCQIIEAFDFSESQRLCFHDYVLDSIMRIYAIYFYRILQKYRNACVKCDDNTCFLGLDLHANIPNLSRPIEWHGVRKLESGSSHNT